MKNTGEDNIKRLLYILQWRLVNTKVGVAEAEEAEAGFSAADWVSCQELRSPRMTDILYAGALFGARAHNLFSIDYTHTHAHTRARLFKGRSANSEFIPAAAAFLCRSYSLP